MALEIYTEDELEIENNIHNEEESPFPLEVKDTMSPGDALFMSKKEYGRLDFPYMTWVTGKTREELTEGLNLYQDPASYMLHEDQDRDWMTEEDFVSNRHIPKLYGEAQTAHEKYGGFDKELKLLERLYPKICALTADDLQMGSKMIPNFLYEIAFERLVGVEVRVEYDAETDYYSVTFVTKPSYVIRCIQYGLHDMDVTKILPMLMNNDELIKKDPVVDAFGKTKYVRNDQKTEELLEAAKRIMRDFKEVLSALLEEDRYYEKVAEQYCKMIGGYYQVSSQTEADWVNPPGLALQPRSHQRKSIEKIITQKVRFLDKDTGSGKTLIMVAGAAELKRLGICQKVLFVIPNGPFMNFVTEVEKYYPGGHYLVIEAEKFSRKKEYYLNLIKEHGHEYDGILMESSSYDLIDMSRAYYLEKIEKEMRRKKLALLNTKRGSISRKLKAQIRALEKKREQLQLKPQKCTACFDQLGIDCLMMDESHHYKNVTLETNFGVISGVNIKGTDKCNINVEKVHYVLRGTETSEGRVVFATATPLKNSLAETFVIQKYLQEDELRYLHMDTFSGWMKEFTETYTKAEIDQDNQHLKYRTRLKFHNLPELHGMLRSVFDYYRIENGDLGIPQCDGYTDVIVPAIKEEEEAYQEIAQKLQDVKLGILSRKEYNSLFAMVESKKLSLDIRELKPEVVPPRGTTKEEYCAKEAGRFYVQYPGMTQVIFCDSSIPKDAFNVYDELKKELILQGIPREEIAFIHDAQTAAQKKKLLEDFNAGVVRILIGSTEKLGTGLNIQQKLVALHMYDCPYSPLEVKQRIGRILRVGNENERVYIVRYLKEKSADALWWQFIATKLVFINAFNSEMYPDSMRESEDIASDIIRAEEAIAYAVGDPKLIEYTELIGERSRMKHASRQRIRKLQELKKRIQEIPEQLDERSMYVNVISQDIRYYQSSRKMMSIEERKQFGENILKAMKRAQTKGEQSLYEYQKFKVIAPQYKPGEKKRYVLLQGIGGGTYKVLMEADTPLGVCKTLDYYLGVKLEKIRERHQAKHRELVVDLNRANDELRQGNIYKKKLAELNQQIEQLEEELQVKVN